MVLTIATILTFLNLWSLEIKSWHLCTKKILLCHFLEFLHCNNVSFWKAHMYFDLFPLTQLSNDQLWNQVFTQDRSLQAYSNKLGWKPFDIGCKKGNSSFMLSAHKLDIGAFKD